jgi:hypothetical protein
VDASGQVIGTDTVLPGFVPSKIGMTIAPRGWNYNGVVLGNFSVIPIFVINTGADTLRVSSLVGLSSPFSVMGLTDSFQPDPAFHTPFSVAPGQKRILGAVFAPPSVNTFADTLIIVGNDPQGPQGVVLTGYSGIAGVEPQPSAATAFLAQNQPNPFRPSTTIRYTLPQAGHVTLEVMDVSGRRIRTLVNTVQPAGSHSFELEARGLAAGIYFYRLRAPGVDEARRMLHVE